MPECDDNDSSDDDDEHDECSTVGHGGDGDIRCVYGVYQLRLRTQLKQVKEVDGFNRCRNCEE